MSDRTIESAPSSSYARFDARQRWLGLCQVHERSSIYRVALQADLSRF